MASVATFAPTFRPFASRPRPCLTSHRARALAVRVSAKHVHPDGGLLGCPDNESGMCEVPTTARMLGSPDSETGMVTKTLDDAMLRPARPHMHVVGHHLIHQNPACHEMGCPDSESGFCEASASDSFSEGSLWADSVEREDLGAWEF